MTGGKVPGAGRSRRSSRRSSARRGAARAAAPRRRRGTRIDAAPRARGDVGASRRRANQYVDRAAPWAEAKKGDQARVDTILATLLERARARSSVMIWPVAARRRATRCARSSAFAPICPTTVGTDVWPRGLRAAPRGRGARAGRAALSRRSTRPAQRALLERLVPEARGSRDAPRPRRRAARRLAAAERAERRVPSPTTSSRASTCASGVVQTCERVPKKDKLLSLTVDVGEAEPRTIVAGLALLVHSRRSSSGSASSSSRTSRRATSARGSSRTGCSSPPGRARSSTLPPSTATRRRARS